MSEDESAKAEGEVEGPKPEKPEEQPPTSVCRFCGTELPSSATFCLKCESFQRWTGVCNHCGVRLPDTAKVCNDCGSYQGPDPDPLDPGPRCRSCRIPIPNNAKICTKCDSAQGIGGYLNLSQVTLTLIIALISVLSAAVPAFKALLPSRSSTSLQLVKVYPDYKLLVLAKNTGDQPSYLLDAAFEFKNHKNASQKLQISEADAEDLASRAIIPGSPRLFHLSVGKGWNSSESGVPKEGELLKDECWIKARISGVREKEESKVQADEKDLKIVIAGKAS